MTLNIPYDQAFVLSLSSLKVINNSQVIKQDRSTGIILAKAGVSWKTSGDKISLRLLPQNNSQVVIEISSKPASPITFVNYGKNLSNVEHLVGFVKRNSEQENGSLLSNT